MGGRLLEQQTKNTTQPGQRKVLSPFCGHRNYRIFGCMFLDGTECTFDTPALGNAQPLYPDTIDYAPLENNAEFLIYEGANAVGKGRVLGRTVPYKVKQQRK